MNQPTKPMFKDKKIPQVIELEEAVLSAMIIDSRGPLEAMPILKASDMFFKNSHRLIFEAINELYDTNQAIDLLTVTAKLRKRGKLDEVGGEAALILLSQKVGSSANIEHHCRIITQAWVKRKLIQKANEVIAKAYDETFDSIDLLELDAKGNDDINEILFTGSKQMTYSDALDAVTDRVELLSNQEEGEFTGVPTGYSKIDSFTGGWQPSDLIIVAARP